MTPTPTVSPAWRDVSPDPNVPQAVGVRRRELDAAWVASPRSREEFIAAHVRGRKVLDLGCVNHTPEAATRPSTLHQMIRDLASSCVGSDFEPAGVAAMRAAGYDVVQADVTERAGPLLARGPFDVIVAGELIEHLGKPQALLDLASELLSAGGKLILTTPNPYAPWRVRAGQRREPWESVDHVTYLFPGGIAEMASRAGMRLVQATSTGQTPSLRYSLAGVLRAPLRRQAPEMPYRRYGLGLPVFYVGPLEWLALLSKRRGGWLGETAVYLIEKPGVTGETAGTTP